MTIDVISTVSIKPKIESCANNKNSVCLTPACIHTAADLLKTIDKSVDPCDDFYKFVCGNFLKTTIIPEDDAEVSRFTNTKGIVSYQLKKVFEQPLSPEDPRYVRLVKKMYNVCMDTDKIEENGLKTVKSILSGLGGWPVVEGSGWDETAFDWKEAVYKIKEAGISNEIFITIDVVFDTNNSSQRMLLMSGGSLPFSAESVKGSTLMAYLNYLIKLAIALGANKKTALEELSKSFEFEYRLAKIQLSEQSGDISEMINRMTIGEFQKKYPNFPLKEFIDRIIGTPSHHVSEDSILNIVSPDYLNKLQDLLVRTPKRVQANYILASVLYNIAYHSTQELYRLKWDFKSSVYGNRELPSRWKDCMKMISDKMDAAVSAVYVKHYFDEEAKNAAMEIVDNIKHSFVDNVNIQEWMDEDTKSQAIEKAKALTAMVGYPQELLDDKVLEQYYAELIPCDDYLQFYLNLKKFNYRKTSEMFFEPVNKSDWREYSNVVIVDAYFSSLANLMGIPAGILQETFFSKGRPNYMNYGGIGSFVGHEFTHGFDDQGRKFNKNGKFVDWWSENSAKIYVEKSKCMSDQYGSYSVPHLRLNVNGVNTLAENIADNGGIKLAYKAYNSWAQRNKNEPQLPGLEYTPNQMYWISVANVRCSKERDGYLRNLIQTDSHAPSNFRVIGPLSNSEDFWKDFNCKVGSKMNPVTKCHVW